MGYTMLGIEERKYYSQGINLNCRYDGRDINTISKLIVNKHTVEGCQTSSTVTYVDSIITCTINLNINRDWNVYIKTIINGDDNNDRILCWDRSERLNYMLKALMFSNPELKSKFSIQDSGYYWNLEINLSTSQPGGSLIDASSYAIRSALSYIKAPRVNVIRHNEGVKLTLDNEDDDMICEVVKCIPIVITCGILNNNCIWSMCENEESCIDGMISFAIDCNNRIVGINGSGSPFINYEVYISRACEIANELFHNL